MRSQRNQRNRKMLFCLDFSKQHGTPTPTPILAIKKTRRTAFSLMMRIILQISLVLLLLPSTPSLVRQTTGRGRSSEICSPRVRQQHLPCNLHHLAAAAGISASTTRFLPLSSKGKAVPVIVVHPLLAHYLLVTVKHHLLLLALRAGGCDDREVAEGRRLLALEMGELDPPCLQHPWRMKAEKRTR